MQHTTSETLIVIAELPVKSERREEFLAYAVANLPLSRDYPGNLRFDLLVDPAQPDLVRFYEEWTSHEAQQAYMAWRIAAGDLTVLMSFLAGEPRFVMLQRIAA